MSDAPKTFELVRCIVCVCVRRCVLFSYDGATGAPSGKTYICSTCLRSATSAFAEAFAYAPVPQRNAVMKEAMLEQGVGQ